RGRVLRERALHPRPGDLDDRGGRRFAHLEPPGRRRHRARLPRAPPGLRARAAGNADEPHRHLAGTSDPSLSRGVASRGCRATSRTLRHRHHHRRKPMRSSSMARSRSRASVASSSSALRQRRTGSRRSAVRGTSLSAMRVGAAPMRSPSPSRTTKSGNGTCVAVLDYLIERRPPFSPDAVVAEYVQALRAYRLTRVQADHYAGRWVVEAFGKHGITCEQSAEPKSTLYGNLLPLLNSGRCELLDHLRLQAQLLGLERRTARGGRDSIDHVPGSHDDLAN